MMTSMSTVDLFDYVSVNQGFRPIIPTYFENDFFSPNDNTTAALSLSLPPVSSLAAAELASIAIDTTDKGHTVARACAY